MRDPDSLVSMLDQAAVLLDQLGAPGKALAPQVLSAWKVRSGVAESVCPW